MERRLQFVSNVDDGVYYYDAGRKRWYRLIDVNIPPVDVIEQVQLMKDSHPWLKDSV